MRSIGSRAALPWLALPVAMILFLAIGCGNQQPIGGVIQSKPADRSNVLVLGDIDPDDPVKKIERFQPLADYLAIRLNNQGIREGKVVIARNIGEMGLFLAEGVVDIYFDSSFPTLAVQEISGSQVILRRWKQNSPEIWSTFIALKGSGPKSIEDLAGKVLAVEEPFSTSGFLLPVGTLAQRGLTVTRVDSTDATVGPNEVGYYFSGDEENTVEMVLRGRVSAGALSNEDFIKLPRELMDDLVTFDRTIAVPRQLVSVRPGLDPEIVSNVRELLIGLNGSPEGLLLLEGLKHTAKFDPIPLAAENSLKDLEGLMDLVARE